MPVTLQSDDETLPLTIAEVEALWAGVRAERDFDDDIVTVRCVALDESRQLKRDYLAQDEATNVLTFSYEDGSHDIALCFPIAEQEAQERGVVLREYVALLLAHAFLHAAGMDHATPAEKQAMEAAELRVLTAAGFLADSLLKEN
ncbi:MAG: rRNA maturation RNase YbeY [Candidatus Andersenbacteria bacterium CG10_big_fil_rev_8_21_14_0_10_54_11]|uniref:Endoribonuclease YbeY n=1 Tax=Candidatus Andersenbacteria bacterium CG10_big_fil_rev_8_21_14_0_10_54_11 TaxID=1974485 RepID=A0A2M6X0M0_9BACT|nr:MAG: rRNA maturation RNase YbeY [Candidatus Andersenbacteria bacterium CG10_big_fil_rev_8_21_14_0_10_54_11]